MRAPYSSSSLTHHTCNPTPTLSFQVHVDLLKNALSDGQLTKPVIDILDQTKNVHDAAAIANVFPPIAKPPSSLVATATAAAYVESGESAPAAVTAGLDSDELKRQQRLEQNKMSARRSRKRKKIILDELQATVEQLTAENEQLEKENKRLEEELERRKKIKESGKGLGPESTSVSSATSFAVPHSFDCGLAAGTSMATAGPPTTSIGVVPSAIPVANRSLLVSQLATIMSGQAAPGLCPQKALGTPTTAGTTLTANSIISSIATPAPRPSQLYLSRPTVNTNANTSTSQSAAAQEQLHRSILSMYQEQERKNANKKRLLGD